MHLNHNNRQFRIFPFFLFLVIIIIICSIPTIRSETFLEYLIDSSTAPPQLSHARQLILLDMSSPIHRNSLSHLMNNSITIVPTDDAWNRRHSWFDVLQNDATLRRRVMMSSITTLSRLLHFTDGKGFARSLSSPSVTYALFDPISNDLLIHHHPPSTSSSSPTIEPHVSHLCLTRQTKPIDPTLTGCCKVSGPYVYDDAIIYLSQGILVREDIKNSLNNKVGETMKRKTKIELEDN